MRSLGSGRFPLSFNNTDPTTYFERANEEILPVPGIEAYHLTAGAKAALAAIKRP